MMQDWEMSVIEYGSKSWRQALFIPQDVAVRMQPVFREGGKGEIQDRFRISGMVCPVHRIFNYGLHSMGSLGLIVCCIHAEWKEVLFIDVLDYRKCRQMLMDHLLAVLDYPIDINPAAVVD